MTDLMHLFWLDYDLDLLANTFCLSYILTHYQK